jgi:hypothetical protein
MPSPAEFTRNCPILLDMDEEIAWEGMRLRLSTILLGLRCCPIGRDVTPNSRDPARAWPSTAKQRSSNDVIGYHPAYHAHVHLLVISMLVPNRFEARPRICTTAPGKLYSGAQRKALYLRFSAVTEAFSNLAPILCHFAYSVYLYKFGNIEAGHIG